MSGVLWHYMPTLFFIAGLLFGYVIGGLMK
jgi:hypothetical protein